MRGEVIAHNFFTKAEALAKRREWLGTQKIVCPECESLQVQLRYYAHVPAEWKCRECKALFEYEP